MQMPWRGGGGGGETEDPRENPPTSGMVRNDTHLRKSRSYANPRIEPAYQKAEEEVQLQLAASLTEVAFCLGLSQALPSLQGTNLTAHHSSRLLALKQMDLLTNRGVRLALQPSRSQFLMVFRIPWFLVTVKEFTQLHKPTSRGAVGWCATDLGCGSSGFESRPLFVVLCACTWAAGSEGTSLTRPISPLATLSVTRRCAGFDHRGENGVECAHEMRSKVICVLAVHDTGKSRTTCSDHRGEKTHRSGKAELRPCPNSGIYLCTRILAYFTDLRHQTWRIRTGSLVGFGNIY
ncbi:hypothetical protein PR048_014500 [Dryococelus australis]|uniref:Uncharacterized protein n=1 Tax=Dryococelus australis TaxID=614101 RepID=A0ABQ9HEF1_9NEOP|nr:hypothetical protein PR048_014500 [Dryococelus australis]